MPSWVIVFLVVVGSVVLLPLAFVSQYAGLYIQAWASNASVSMSAIIGMRLRKVDVRTIIITHIRLHKADLHVPLANLETHYLAGGSPSRVATAMISATRRGGVLTWEEAATIDLGPDDLLEVVRARFGGHDPWSP